MSLLISRSFRNEGSLCHSIRVWSLIYWINSLFNIYSKYRTLSFIFQRLQCVSNPREKVRALFSQLVFFFYGCQSYIRKKTYKSDLDTRKSRFGFLRWKIVYFEASFSKKTIRQYRRWCTSRENWENVENHSRKKANVNSNGTRS